MTKTRLIRALMLALVVAFPLAAQDPPPQPPDPATHPNVKDVTIAKDDTKTLEVKKSDTVPVKEIWKYSNGTWEKVWDTDSGGDFVVSNQEQDTTKIKNNPVTERFKKGDKFRVVIQATDSSGNSTSIESIKERSS